MARRLLTAICAVLLTPPATTLASVQDSLFAVADSVEAVAPELLFLSGENVLMRQSPGSETADESSARLWRLHETLEQVVVGLAPESGRLAGLPLMRGLGAKRMSVTFDGVPLSHSGLREGPSGIPLAAIDPAVIGGVGVSRGPLAAGASVDALAGALLIGSSLDGLTRRPDSHVPAFEVSQRFSSADRGWSGAVSATGALDRLQYSLGSSGRLLGDLRKGSGGEAGPVLQPNTSLSESTLYGMASFAATDSWGVTAGTFSTWRVGQAVVDDLENLRLSPLPETIDVFDPRHFAFGYVSAHGRGLGPVDHLESTLWFNRYRESRTIRRGGWERTLFDDDRLTASGLSAKATLQAIGSHTPGIQLDIQLEGVESDRWEVRDDRTVWFQRGRFPVGTTSRLLGVAVTDSWRLARTLRLDGEVRFATRRIHAAYGPSTFGVNGLVGLVDRSFSGASWRTGLTQAWASGFTLSASVASGFRAPGLDDMVANAHWLHGRDVPNPGLDPERATQFEVAGRFVRGSLQAGASVFYTSYRHLIGRDWFEAGPDGAPGTPDDLYRFVNHESASIRGLEADVSATVGSWSGLDVAVDARLAVHQWSGHDIATPRYMPPAVARVGTRLASGRLWLEPYVRFAARTPASVYSVAGAVEAGTPGWITVNVRGGMRLAGGLLVAVAVENAGDERYREHGSYIEGAGRNVVLSVSYRF